ncbi:hypothetical protein RvY_12925-2 [Ramazzottius varieornatus]|uniref:Uncharacterized protein n=1 Tax=Ramazzottius varieornatus TaxID=947166 RepID=A0A1D1VNE1_RAMVA|nr:hypothetical protein RvY_12925-2 [Ramazzottius varieornatus]
MLHAECVEPHHLLRYEREISPGIQSDLQMLRTTCRSFAAKFQRSVSLWTSSWADLLPHTGLSAESCRILFLRPTRSRNATTQPRCPIMKDVAHWKSFQFVGMLVRYATANHGSVNTCSVVDNRFDLIEILMLSRDIFFALTLLCILSNNSSAHRTVLLPLEN